MTDKPKTPDGLSEATAKFEHEAEAAVTDPAEAVPKSSDTTGRTKIQRLYPQALGVLEQFRKAADGQDPDRIYERIDELREQIMETPATCPQDVAIKLRLFANIMDIVHRPDLLPEMGDNAAEGYLRTAICDLECLAGGNATEAA